MGKASGDQRNCKNGMICESVRRQGVHEIEKMNCPVDGKGVRESTKLREWDDLWTGKASGDQRNLGKMDDLEKNKSDKSQRSA